MDREIQAGACPDPAEALHVQQRLSRAVQSLQRHTVDTFVTRYMETIERQNAQLRGFNRLVSHELRQPLGVLALLARVIPATVRDDALTPLIGTLERNVQRLGEIVGKLERLARVEHAADTPVTQVVPLATLARDAAAQLEEMAAARGVEILIDDCVPEARVEPARAELVFLNLLANAVKYSDPDKPARCVRVHRLGEAGIAVVIEDNGIGIPADRLASIFDEFVRVHAERDEELGATGLGIGLSIVRDCMRSMEGAVEVQSRPGIGTTFVLRWPDSAAP
jgi:signal transduction histidine kinase